MTFGLFAIGFANGSFLRVAEVGDGTSKCVRSYCADFTNKLSEVAVFSTREEAQFAMSCIDPDEGSRAVIRLSPDTSHR